jgi:hypothetical protein
MRSNKNPHSFHEKLSEIGVYVLFKETEFLDHSSFPRIELREIYTEISYARLLRCSNVTNCVDGFNRAWLTQLLTYAVEGLPLPYRDCV